MIARFSRRNDVQLFCTAVCIALLSTIVLRESSCGPVQAKIPSRVLQVLLRIPGLILFFTWSFFVSLAVVSLILCFLLNHAQKRKQRYENSCREQPRNEQLAFPTQPGNYFNRALTDRPQPFVYPESEHIEREIQEIIAIVLTNHINSWYKHISDRPLFPSVVEYLLRNALINLKKRLELVDVVGIIVRKAVPIITQHLHEITIAEQHVVNTLETVGIDALEQSSICEAVAANCKGRQLHLAARVAQYDEDHILKPEDKLQTYLRTTVERLLPALLDNQELASPVVTVFIREIIACAILEPLFNMLADPDFWNETLVVRANQVIQERARVKRFRHVLKEQTQASATRTKSSRRKPMKTLERLMVSTDQRDWDRLYRKIKKSQSLVDVTRMRDEIMILKNEMLAATDAEENFTPAELRVKKTSRSDHFVIKAMSLLETRIASLGGGHTAASLSTSTQLSFDRILVVGTSYFFEFLERHGRVTLLDFWQHVIQFKIDTAHPMPASQLQVLDSPVHFSQDEIRTIVSQFFSSPLLTVTEDERQLLTNYPDNEPDVYDVDSNEIIVNVARRAYKTMETDDFPVFRTDKLYFNMMTGMTNESSATPSLMRSLSNVSMSRSMSSPTIDARQKSSLDLADLEQDYFRSETMGLIDSTEKDVLEAMEDALHSSLLSQQDEQTSSQSASLHNATDSDLDDLVSFQDGHEPNSSPIVRIDVPSNGDSNINDVKTAEPGDLNLVEEIDVLEAEIEKRKHSLDYIDKFLSNKRDIDHLDRKVVLKSRAQTSRELESLQAQKEQYTADDHALYGRSTVIIEHSTTHQDELGNDYVVYIVEVRRTSADGTQAGWIITRRYSEFNELHAQLKQQFPRIANLDFPKKQLNRLKSVADTRRPVLQSFLQNLLKDEAICKSSLLRNFLSQNNRSVKKRHHKTVFESLTSLADPREAFSRLFALLESPDEPRIDNPDLREVHPAPSEAHDEILSSFAKPIVDLVLEAFDLRERSKWMKKKAVVLILQQILGGTIESRVRDTVSGAFEEHPFAATLEALKTRLTRMPTEAGKAPVKTKAERLRVMDLAKQTLRAYNPSYVPESAAKKIFRALQIRTLNMHLLGNITDSLVEAILVV